jgi:hypothetical protein
VPATPDDNTIAKKTDGSTIIATPEAKKDGPDYATFVANNLARRFATRILTDR